MLKGADMARTRRPISCSIPATKNLSVFTSFLRVAMVLVANPHAMLCFQNDSIFITLSGMFLKRSMTTVERTRLFNCSKPITLMACEIVSIWEGKE